MFGIYSNDTGASTPFEYLPATGATYKAGQMVEVSNGKIKALSGACTTTPPYMSITEGTVADGENICVVRVQEGTIYETTLSAVTSGAKVGALLQVAADGLQVNLTAPGQFELVAVEGTAAGSTVRGRFLGHAAGAPA